MFGKRGKHLISVMMTLLCAAFLGMPVFAGIPSTGDGSGMLLPIMGGLLVWRLRMRLSPSMAEV